MKRKTRESIYWDDTLVGYRYKGSGNKVPPRGILAILKRDIAETNRLMEQATNKLINEKLSFEDWQRENLALIREIHVDSLRLGKGGKDRTFANDYLRIARDLKDVHYASFRRLSEQIKSGELSEKQIRYRQSLYAKSGKISYEKGRGIALSAASEKVTWYTRHLGSCANHCLDCIRLALLGSVPFSEAIFPGEKCRCGVNCCCYGVVSESIQEIKRDEILQALGL